MIAVVLALSVSTVSAAALSPLDGPLVQSKRLSFAPTACRAGVITAADESLLRPQDRAALRFRKLGDLPKAHHEIAVHRTVMGCAAPLIVRYDVERDGRFVAPSTGGGK
jgi:hypothetical protein